MRIVAAVLVMLAGCMADVGYPGGSGPPTDDVGPADDPRVDETNGCGGGATVVRGTVTFPNGELPVDRALVYVAAPGATVERSGTCGECVDLGGALGHAISSADGRFEIVGVPGGPQILVVEKGPFRRAAEIDVAACEDNLVPAEATRLPGDESEGEVPRIAVVAGDYDRMEDVLVKLGMSADSFDVVSARALLGDAQALAAYDIVFVDCGATFASPDSANRVAMDTAAVRSFVDGGGRLYVTDLSYDVVERAFPALLDFHGSAGNGLGEQAETLGPAEIGDELARLTASIEDEALRAWLQVTGAAAADGTIALEGFLGGWSVLDEVSTHAKVWVRADVSWGSDPWFGVTPGRGERPMTATFEAGCGRALFTSYHTVEEAWNEGASGALSAQEQLLAYLILEIGTCIEEPELF